MKISARLKESETARSKLKSRMVHMAEQLDKAGDSRRTAVARAEATNNHARKMKQEIERREELVAKHQDELVNLHGQVSMKEREFS